VWCLTGDQGFLNGCQALACLGEQNANVTIIVCNNGGSISLLKQTRAQDPYAFDAGRMPFLENASNVNVLEIARGFGIEASRVTFDPDVAPVKMRHPFRKALTQAASKKRPYIIELCVPLDMDAWAGIWTVKGLDGR
jgi:thiamine pyrophosphate-dependent acetolactate synthase large subunit-like protein